MKILFGVKYFGKDTSEVPSKFLVFCIEEYSKADWSLINACKQELTARLKLDWTPPTPEQQIINQLRRQLATAEKQIDHLHAVIAMSTINKGNEIQLEAYLKCPELLQAHMELIREANA